MAAITQPVPQEAAVAEAIATIAPPKGVRLRRVYFDTDHSGDPAVYIVYAVSKSLGLGPARIRSLGILQNKVTEAVDALHLDRLSYVRFEDVK